MWVMVRYAWRVRILLLVVFCTGSSLFAQDAPDNLPGPFGMTVGASRLTMSPLEYSSVYGSASAYTPPGGLRQNTESATPVAFWYYNAANRLLFEFDATRVVLRQAQYTAFGRVYDGSGGFRPATFDAVLPAVSRSTQSLQVLRPVDVGSTTLYFGGGVRNLLREASASTGTGVDYARWRTLAAELTLRWVIPVTGGFSFEAEGVGYAGSGTYQHPPYLYVNSYQPYVFIQTTPGVVVSHAHGANGNLRVRYRFDRNVSLVVGYEAEYEWRSTDYAEGWTAYGDPAAGLQVYRSVQSNGRRTLERLYGYSMGLTLQL